MQVCVCVGEGGFVWLAVAGESRSGGHLQTLAKFSRTASMEGKSAIYESKLKLKKINWKKGSSFQEK